MNSYRQVVVRHRQGGRTSELMHLMVESMKSGKFESAQMVCGTIQLARELEITFASRYPHLKFEAKELTATHMRSHLLTDELMGDLQPEVVYYNEVIITPVLEVTAR